MDKEIKGYVRFYNIGVLEIRRIANDMDGDAVILFLSGLEWGASLEVFIAKLDGAFFYPTVVDAALEKNGQPFPEWFYKAENYEVEYS